MLEKKELNQISGVVGKKLEMVNRKLIKEVNRKTPDEIIKLTKKRLYSYPQLKRNLKRYQLDIEDIKKENFGRSKSIVVMQPTYANPLTTEDKRTARVKLIEEDMERDQREINKIELALEEIKDDEYYCAFELYFFKHKVYEEIAEELYKSRTSISRNVGRMVNQLAVFFYGADALH